MVIDNETKVIAFRVDASLAIGTGHVTRCLTLANMLSEHGVRSHFICRAHTGHMAEKIEEYGYNVLLLPLLHEGKKETNNSDQSKYASWLGATLINDANETIQYLKEINPVWLVVDHFAIDARWEIKIKVETALKIMVIDGLADRKHECDLLLDQTYSQEGNERWANMVPENCKLIVGPKYALLRPEFLSAYRNLRQRNTKVKRILIAFGGIDDPNATFKTLEAMGKLNRIDIKIDVVIGALNPHRKTLVKKFGNINNVEFYVEPENIADLMVAADLAVGGGGTMMWERCLLKLPTILISIADNQVELSKVLHSISAVVYIGDVSRISCDSIRDNIERLINNEKEIKEIQSAVERLMLRDNYSIPKYLLTYAQ